MPRSHARTEESLENSWFHNRTGCYRKTERSFARYESGTIRREIRLCTKMFSKDYCIPVSSKMCKWVKYSLLNSRKWLQWRHLLVNAAHGGLPTDKSFWLYSAVRLALNLNRVNYSICSALQKLAQRLKMTDIEHTKQVLNRCWDMINQELINGAKLTSDLNDCCWTFIRRMGTLDIVSVNSVMCDACCKLYFCHDFHWKCCPFWCFLTSSLTQLLYKEYLNVLFKRCHLCDIK